MKEKSFTEYMDYLIEYDFETLDDNIKKSFKSVTGENYVNDMAIYTEFTEKTLVLAREHYNKSLELSNHITDEEIFEIHKYQINSSFKRMNSVLLHIDAIKQQNRALGSEANEKMNEAVIFALDYKREIRKFLEKYDLEYLCWF